MAGRLLSCIGDRSLEHSEVWIYGARMFVVNKRDNAEIMMDRIVKQEVEGTGRVKIMRTQLVDITEQIKGGVWEELVGEVVLGTPCLRADSAPSASPLELSRAQEAAGVFGRRSSSGPVAAAATASVLQQKEKVYTTGKE
ncbi:hypothetical protein E2562_005579 [Oryza meyeriana var. granulata]|uniref:Uncharacterized protein n=1 Tax=Oryza meyeriana var. granulata TaxID=110450 RepID=A0A6G1F462_9ORYZ|nr:hypothetical protein E2562_005579 [Oryza meyeriana var. granulata]